MMITPGIHDQLVNTLKSKYGAWSGFGEAAFVEDETAYKRKIIQDVQPLLPAVLDRAFRGEL